MVRDTDREKTSELAGSFNIVAGFKKLVATTSLVYLSAALASWLIAQPRAVHAQDKLKSPQNECMNVEQANAVIAGNTINGGEIGYRQWWVHYFQDGLMIFRSDAGKKDFGFWEIKQNGQFCRSWGIKSPSCWYLRLTGIVLRLDTDCGAEATSVIHSQGNSQNMDRENTVIAARKIAKRFAGIPTKTQQSMEILKPLMSMVSPATDPARTELAVSEVPENPTPATIKVAFRQGNDDVVVNALDGISGGSASLDGVEADLIWDGRQGTIRDKKGTLIAEMSTYDRKLLQDVVYRSSFIATISRTQAYGAGDFYLRLRPAANSYRPSQQVSLVSSGHRYENILLFNVGPTGEIDLIFPLRLDFRKTVAPWPSLPPQLGLSIELVMTAPFGSNALIALASDDPPDAVLIALQNDPNIASDSAFLKALLKAANAANAELTVTNAVVRRVQ
jgi:hypothetical protein